MKLTVAKCRVLHSMGIDTKCENGQAESFKVPARFEDVNRVLEVISRVESVESQIDVQFYDSYAPRG